MAKSTETASAKSSNISSKATSLKNTVRKGATALTRPFKKLKKTISTASTRSIRSIRSRSSATLPLSEGEAANGDKSSVDGRSSHSRDSDSDPEVELTPEQELGMFFFFCIYYITNYNHF